MNKKGSAGEWLILIAALIISIIAIVMVLTVPYSKSDVDQKVNLAKQEAITKVDTTKQELMQELEDKVTKPGCIYVEIDPDRDAGKWYDDICGDREPLIRVAGKHLRSYRNTDTSLNVKHCDDEFLLFNEYLSIVTVSNLGSPVQRRSDADCYLKDYDNGFSEIAIEADDGIICC